MASRDRHIRKSRLVQGALSRIYTAYIRLVLRTTRWKLINVDRLEAEVAAGRPHVYCTWHRNITLTPLARNWNDHPFAVLASDHEDARLLAEGFARSGIGYIALKTSGDNSAVLRDAVRAVRKGASLGICPDGPLGPAEVAKPGAVLIASMARVPVTASTYAISRKIRLKTWDGMILPLPFSRGVFLLGESFQPPPKLTAEELDAACAELGRMINRANEAAEAALAEWIADGR